MVEATSVHDTEVDDGTTTGICPLTVHGITGEQYANASTQVLKIVAMVHLTESWKVSGKTLHYILKCFPGFSHMVLKGLVTRDTKEQCLMLHTKDTC